MRAAVSILIEGTLPEAYPDELPEITLTAIDESLDSAQMEALHKLCDTTVRMCAAAEMQRVSRAAV